MLIYQLMLDQTGYFFIVGNDVSKIKSIIASKTKMAEANRYHLLCRGVSDISYVRFIFCFLHFITFFKCLPYL